MRALIILVLLSGTAYADDWTVTDSVAQGACLTSLAADYLQTREIVDRARAGTGGREMNPVMGHYGERVPPVLYFSAVAALHTGAAYILPQPWRRLAQVALVVVQVDSVAHNWRAGYTVTF